MPHSPLFILLLYTSLLDRLQIFFFVFTSSLVLLTWFCCNFYLVRRYRSLSSMTQSPLFENLDFFRH
ncbi:hypothetical protein Hanom_Chr10g00920151 [Helianthus anomalus]